MMESHSIENAGGQVESKNSPADARKKGDRRTRLLLSADLSRREEAVTVPHANQRQEATISIVRRIYSCSKKLRLKLEPWRFVGFMSSVVGLSCSSLSPSFQRLIGGWNAFKFFLYGVVVIFVCATILLAKKCSLSLPRRGKHTAYVGFAVLILTSLYSFLYEKAINGKPDILSVVSNAAFALMSLSFSRVLELGFEAGLFAFFIGFFAVQLMMINLFLIFVAIIYGCPLFVIHSSSSDSRPEAEAEPLSSLLNSQPEAEPLVHGYGDDQQEHVIDIDKTSTSSGLIQESKQIVWTGEEDEPLVSGDDEHGARDIDRTSTSNGLIQESKQIVWNGEEDEPLVSGDDEHGARDIDRTSTSNGLIQESKQIVWNGEDDEPLVSGDDEHGARDIDRTSASNGLIQESKQIVWNGEDDKPLVGEDDQHGARNIGRSSTSTRLRLNLDSKRTVSKVVTEDGRICMAFSSRPTLRRVYARGLA